VSVRRRLSRYAWAAGCAALVAGAGPAGAVDALSGTAPPVCRAGKVDIIVGGRQAPSNCESSEAATARSAASAANARATPDANAEAERRRILLDELAQERLRLAQLEQDNARGQNTAALARARENVAALQRELDRTGHR
jgi:hypothetical protein